MTREELAAKLAAIKAEAAKQEAALQAEVANLEAQELLTALPLPLAPGSTWGRSGTFVIEEGGKIVLTLGTTIAAAVPATKTAPAPKSDGWPIGEVRRAKFLGREYTCARIADKVYRVESDGAVLPGDRPTSPSGAATLAASHARLTTGAWEFTGGTWYERTTGPNGEIYLRAGRPPSINGNAAWK